MRATFLLLCLSLAACRTSKLGACSKDTDCPAEGVCGPSAVCEIATCSPSCATGSTCTHGACVAGGGGCTPACSASQTCVSGVCLSQACNPPCDSSHTCDASTLMCVPNPPAIGTITLTPACISVNGGCFYGPGGAITVTATITDAAGVDASTVCMSVAGGACVTGTPGASNTFTFSLARPTAATDGATPVDFTITAADSLYASLTGPSKAAHITTTAAQHVLFDNQPPAVSVAADTTPYARTLPNGSAAPITISALVSDGTGVGSAYLLSGANTVDAGFVDGGLYQFQLNPKDAPAGVEGAYAFAVVVTDGVGNATDAGASRIIDDAPPALSMRVFQGSDPGKPGVTYPSAVANTGHTGVSFIYSDTVHIKGTLNDVSGIGAAAVHIDGIDLDGGVTTGVSKTLGCTVGATACSFDLQVALNDPQNGAFHTGTATIDGGSSGLAIPNGVLQLNIAAQDQAVAADGTPSPHAEDGGVAATTTRLLWQQALTSGNVTGLAVHPSGDAIATTNGSVTGDSVYDLAPDQPLLRWSFGSGVALGAIPDEPSIGAGSGSAAAIYAASKDAGIYAIAPDGGELWQSTGLASFSVGPAVDSAAWTDGGTVEQAVVPDNNTGGPMLWAVSSANSTAPFSITADDIDLFSSPIIFKGFVWFGDGQQTNPTFQGNVARHAQLANGTYGAAAAVLSNANRGNYRPSWGLVTDGTTVFTATNRPTQGTHFDMFSVTVSTFAFGWDTTGAHLSGEPTIGIDGKLLASDYTANHAVSKVAPATGVFTQLISLGATASESPPFGHVPLQGSDGHVYLPVTISASNGMVMALEGGQISWQLLLPSATMVRAAAMDCSGRLFVGNGNTVYALVSDDHGLADTPWPNLRRDARNTGNASAPKYGIRTSGSVCTQ